MWLKYPPQHLYLYACPRQRIRHDLQHGSQGHGPRGPDRLGLPRSLFPGHYRVRVSPTSSGLGITSTVERTASLHRGRNPDIEWSRPRLSNAADVHAIRRIESICAHGRYDLGKPNQNDFRALLTAGQALHSTIFYIRNSILPFDQDSAVLNTMRNWRRIWTLRELMRLRENFGTPAPLTGDENSRWERWKQAGFMKDALQLWILGQIMLDRGSRTSDNNALRQIDQPGMNGLKRYLGNFGGVST